MAVYEPYQPLDMEAIEDELHRREMFRGRRQERSWPRTSCAPLGADTHRKIALRH